MQQNMTGTFTVPCSQTSNVAAYLRVKADATYGLALAGSGDRELGVLATEYIASGLGSSQYATLCATNSSPAKYVANGAIGRFAACYAAANGQIAGTGTLFIGWALDAATAAGDVIRVLRDWPATGGVTPAGLVNPTVATLAAAGTVSAGAAQIASQVVTVSGANGTKAVKLPAPGTYGFVEVINEVLTSSLPVVPNAAETIDGGTGATVPAGSRTMFWSDGTNWWSAASKDVSALAAFSALPAPAGSTAANAAQIASSIYWPIASGVNGTVGSKLPAPAPGLAVTVVNDSAASALLIYGYGSENIDGTAGTTAVSLAAGKTRTFRSDGTNWRSVLG